MEPTMEAGLEPGGGIKAVPWPVVQIDEGRIEAHLEEVVWATVEETLNALQDAEADRLCGARKYERTEGRKDTRAGSYDRQLSHQGRGKCQGWSKTRPLWRSKSRPVVGYQVVECSGETFGAKDAIIVADENTYEAAGKEVEASFLRESRIQTKRFVFGPHVHANDSCVRELAEAFRLDEGIPVAVGSGTINDLTKLRRII
jgi:hypothetical protein